MKPSVAAWLKSAGRATQEELLDRVTVLREAMEPAAVEVFEAELAGRGVTPEEIEAHARDLRHRVLRDTRDLPLTCCKCARAATESQREFHWWRMFLFPQIPIIPLFPRQRHYCDQHWANRPR